MKLTVTFELGPVSVEAAMAKIDAWRKERFDKRGMHILKVEAGDSDPRLRAVWTGHKLAERRRRLGLSQHDLAKQARVGQAAISEVERGVRGPHSQAAISMDRALTAAEGAR